MFSVVLPVGPGEREIDRMNDVLSELATHEGTHDIQLLVVDDDPTPRDLQPRWPRVTVIRTELRQHRSTIDPYSAMVATTLEGFSIAAQHHADWAVKLDTDVAVIGPFSQKINDTFRSDERLGIVGSYDRTSRGDVRDWTVWDDTLSRIGRTWRITRSADGRRSLRRKTARDRRYLCQAVNLARQNAPLGAHCLGGAYAVSRRFLDRVDMSWRPWVDTGISEDVVTGTLCSAVGLKMRSLVSPGDPFALAWQGLPASPTQLARNGHSIVHSVKCATPAEEREIRVALQRAVSRFA